MRVLYLLFFILLFLASLVARAQEGKTAYGVFSFEQQITLPGNPERIYDAISGDISGWWDHSFSDKPFKLFLEAKPGGGFFEIFDEQGNGVKHATVIYADRGKMLRFDGPLGLAGSAIQMVTTYTFTAKDSDSTLLKLAVHASGEVPEGIQPIVERVWYHFLFERFKPYVEKGFIKPE